MQHSPWEANRFSASQKIPRILRNPKVHYRTHKCPPPVPTLSQIDPVHTPTSHFLKIHLNIITLSPPGASKWSLSLRVPHQNLVYTSPLPHKCYLSRPSHSSRFDQPKKKKILRWRCEHVCKISALNPWSHSVLYWKLCRTRNTDTSATTKASWLVNIMSL